MSLFEKPISIIISSEHKFFLDEIKNLFPDIEVDANYSRKGLEDLPIQVLIFIGQAVIGNAIYDILKSGIQIFFNKFNEGKVIFRIWNGMMFNINKKGEVKAITFPDKMKEFEHVKNIDDLIKFLEEIKKEK